MRKQIKYSVLLIIALCFSCSSNDDSPPDGTGNGGETIQASYRITFEPNFTTQFHATDYPDDASFIKPFIIAHGSGTSVFSVGSFASAGMKQYAEEGSSSSLVTAHTPGEDNVNPTVIVQGATDVGPTETKVYIINVTPNTTLISFVTKISPSPDWFLGIDSFDLVNSDDTLVETANFELFAMDAGTDSGETYTSADSAESETIKIRTGLPLSNVVGQTGKSLGMLTIERINTN